MSSRLIAARPITRWSPAGHITDDGDELSAAEVQALAARPVTVRFGPGDRLPGRDWPGLGLGWRSDRTGEAFDAIIEIDGRDYLATLA